MLVLAVPVEGVVLELVPTHVLCHAEDALVLALLQLDAEALDLDAEGQLGLRPARQGGAALARARLSWQAPSLAAVVGRRAPAASARPSWPSPRGAQVGGLLDHPT